MNRHQFFRRLGLFAGILALAVLSCSGLSSVSSLFTTATPTPTLTFTPSPTLTPSPTFTPTLTPSPSSTPAPTGANTEEQPDGSTRFMDYDNKYQLILPDGWIVLSLSTKDMADILQDISQENPEYKDIAETFKKLDPDVIRVMALNKDPSTMVGGFSTSLSVMAVDNKVMSTMPLDFVMGALEDSIKPQATEESTTALATAESITQQNDILVLSNTITKNANGVEMGSLDYQQNVPALKGGKVSVRYKALIFQAGGKLIVIQLGTPEQFAEKFLPVMDQIAASVKLSEQ